MGGYNSGRTKEHFATDECLQLDVKLIKSALAQPGKHRGKFTAGEQNVNAVFEVSDQRQAGAMMLGYTKHTQGRPESERTSHRLVLDLVTTPCNYGGRRWWIIAPCCGARVRVLYFVHADIPQCRMCADLHYRSQQASATDRQIAYEKHLLRNWGYSWAKRAYMQMKEHFFEITPEYREIAARSDYDRQLYLLQALMRFNRIMMNTHVRALRSLRTKEAREEYLLFIIQEWGVEHALTMFRLSGIQLLPADEQLEATVQKEVHEIVESGRADPLQDYDILTQANIIARQEEIEHELKHADLTQAPLHSHLALI